MATRIIAKNTLKRFADDFPNAAKALMAWHDVVSKATIGSFAAAQAVDPKVSLVNGTYLVFDIRGGHYRLITTVYYPSATLYIKHFFTHKQYDAWTAEMRKQKR